METILTTGVDFIPVTLRRPIRAFLEYRGIPMPAGPLEVTKLLPRSFRMGRGPDEIKDAYRYRRGRRDTPEHL